MLVLGVVVGLVSMHARVHALIWGHAQIHPEDGFLWFVAIDMFSTRLHYIRRPAVLGNSPATGTWHDVGLKIHAPSHRARPISANS